MLEQNILGENERLAEIKGGLFTSDLSVDELYLLKQSGFSPVGMVMGSSIYHMGIQVGRWNQSQELEVLTKAMHEARENSLNRMIAEGKALGADGIVGTNMTMQSYVGGQDVLEFIAIGTAIKFDADPGSLTYGDGRPFSSHLDGVDFIKLWHMGLIPTHFSFGVCVYHVAHQSIRSALKQAGQNQEMPQYTQAIYSARELALGRMQSEAKMWGSSGIVGSSVYISNHVWGEHAVEFMALGTGVRPHGYSVTPLPAVTPVVSFNQGN